MSAVNSKLVCQICHIEFAHWNKNKTKYVCCSKKCAAVASSIAKGRKLEIKPSATCKVCGSYFLQKKPAHYFCSKGCKNKVNAARAREINGWREKGLHQIVCKHCGKSAYVINPTAIYCSKKCKGDASPSREKIKLKRSCKALELLVKRKQAEYINEQHALAIIEKKERERKIKQIEKTEKRRKVKECAFCKVLFCPMILLRAKFCSDECANFSFRESKKAARKARKARQITLKVENVVPLKVFRRDKWTCYLCGRKTLQELRGTYEDLATELDHVVPLSKNGEHSYANIKCACRACNIRKSNTNVKKYLKSRQLTLQI